MRDTRTLKGLFADPLPPRRKNFIKENVKSVRQMEKLFHANDKNIKVPKTIKVSSKHNGISKNYTNQHNSLSDSKGENNGNELAKLLSKSLYLENQDNRKINAPVFSHKKTAPVKKFTRPCIHRNVLRKNQLGYKDQTNCKIKQKQKLKSHSIDDIGSQGLKEQSKNSDQMKSQKSQGVQTLDAKDIDSLYSEGVIRYPSGKLRETENLKTDRGDMISEQNDLEYMIQDSTRTNKGSISVASKLVSQLSNGAPPSSYRVGVVPKYIKERKEALQREQLAKIAAKQSDCPKGHVPLPDCERKETLNVLKKNYQEYVLELNTLPIRTDTLRSQKRKIEIEKQLAKLEEAIKVFSRPKVLVKIDS